MFESAFVRPMAKLPSTRLPRNSLLPPVFVPLSVSVLAPDFVLLNEPVQMRAPVPLFRRVSLPPPVTSNVRFVEAPVPV